MNTDYIDELDEFDGMSDDGEQRYMSKEDAELDYQLAREISRSIADPSYFGKSFAPFVPLAEYTSTVLEALEKEAFRIFERLSKIDEIKSRIDELAQQETARSERDGALQRIELTRTMIMQFDLDLSDAELIELRDSVSDDWFRWFLIYLLYLAFSRKVSINQDSEMIRIARSASGSGGQQPKQFTAEDAAAFLDELESFQTMSM